MHHEKSVAIYQNLTTMLLTNLTIVYATDNSKLMLKSYHKNWGASYLTIQSQ